MQALRLKGETADLVRVALIARGGLRYFLVDDLITDVAKDGVGRRFALSAEELAGP